MYLSNLAISDSTIISLLEEKNPAGWEFLYDKYAPMMYSTIYDLTDNAKIAEEIFLELLFRLKQPEILSQISVSIGRCVYRYTYNFTLQQLKALNRMPVLMENTMYDNCELLKLLWSQPLSITEAGFQLNLTEGEAQKKLQHELNYIHHHHESRDGEHSPHQHVTQFSKINLNQED